MSNRMESIYQFMVADRENKKGGIGWTTKELAEKLAMQRSNVSKDLNELVRQ